MLTFLGPAKAGKALEAAEESAMMHMNRDSSLHSPDAPNEQIQQSKDSLASVENRERRADVVGLSVKGRGLITDPSSSPNFPTKDLGRQGPPNGQSGTKISSERLLLKPPGRSRPDRYSQAIAAIASPMSELSDTSRLSNTSGSSSTPSRPKDHKCHVCKKPASPYSALVKCSSPSCRRQYHAECHTPIVDP